MILAWAREVKPDLLKLQRRTGIPALFAAAQFCHESCNWRTERLTELASVHHNYAGLKWAEWQRTYGCSPITYGTWEVIEGNQVDLDAAFCSCPNWEIWLQVYAALLTGELYGPALRFASAPYLYGRAIWAAGWATDPHYLAGIANWMGQLWDDYVGTLAASIVSGRPVPIVDAGGRQLCEGWLQDDRTVVRVRDLAEAQGQVVEFDPVGPAVRLCWPGIRQT